MPRVKVNVKEVDLLQRRLGRLGSEITGVAKYAVYDGAKVAADALRRAVDNLQRVPDYDYFNAIRRGERTYMSVTQKNGLRAGLGIATMRVTADSVNTVVGFNGYNGAVTKRWPSGQPNRMVAAEVNHGHSARIIQQPFITVTKEVYARDIRMAMHKSATQKISEIMES